MTQVVSWSGEWTIRPKKGKSIKVCTIVVASRHGIMRADFKAAADGSLDMQSEYQPGTWGKNPGSTTAQSLWGHKAVTAIHDRCHGPVTQHDLASAAEMFEYFALHEQCSSGSHGAYELWRNWCEMTTGFLSEPEPYSGGQPPRDDGFIDLISMPTPCPYLGDSRYGIY